jgi:hypothetical protein
MPTTKDIKVVLTTPTIQKNLNVAVPLFPNTNQVLNISKVNELINLRDQNLINEYFNEKFKDIDIVANQKLAFISTITADATTTDLLNQAIQTNGALFPGNFWIVKVPKFDQIAITNVEDNPDYGLRDEEGDSVPNNESLSFKNKDWIVYTNKKEFQKIDLKSAVEYGVLIHSTLSNAVGALTQQDVNEMFDRIITKNTIKTIKDAPDADSNGERNDLWFEIIESD